MIIVNVHDDDVVVDIIAVHRRICPPCCPHRLPKLFPSFLLPPLTKLQVDFDRRFVDDIGNDCLMSVDGTDFWISLKGQAKKGNPFASQGC
jgi:hypothetical protein